MLPFENVPEDNPLNMLRDGIKVEGVGVWFVDGV